jgi:hypothetical protein
MKKLMMIVTALAMITASVNAAWKYQDIQDQMGRYAPEHQALVYSSDGRAFLKLTRYPNDGTTGVWIWMLDGGVLNGERQLTGLYDIRVSIRLDNDQILTYRFTAMADYGLDHASMDEGQAPPFVQALRSATTLRVEVPSYGRRLVVYTFDVNGLVW